MRVRPTTILALAAMVSCTGVGPFGIGGSLSVSPATPMLGAIGQTVQLQLLDTDAGTGATTWRSSDTGVAQVSSSGVVLAVGNGTATITAESGGRSGTATITVAATIINTFRITGLDQADGNARNDAASATITVRAN